MQTCCVLCFLWHIAPWARVIILTLSHYAKCSTLAQRALFLPLPPPKPELGSTRSQNSLLNYRQVNQESGRGEIGLQRVSHGRDCWKEFGVGAVFLEAGGFSMFTQNA